MAEVIALPTAAAEPVPRRRWRGQYPKGVVPIAWQRVKRKDDEHKRRCQAIRVERVREEMEEIERRGRDTVPVLRALLARALKGQLDGIYVAFRDRDGSEAVVTTGRYE